MLSPVVYNTNVLTTKFILGFKSGIPHSHMACHIPYFMPFKKLASLIFALLSPRIAFFSSCLLATASNAPSTLPSVFDGRSIVCCWSGIFGMSDSVSPEAIKRASSLRCFLATKRRVFLDLAVRRICQLRDAMRGYLNRANFI